MSLSTWTTAHPAAPLSTGAAARFDASVRHEIAQLADGYRKDAAAYSQATAVLWESIYTSFVGGRLPGLGWSSWNSTPSHSSAGRNGRRSRPPRS